MTKTPIVYVYGISDSGKTRLVERLVLMLIQKGHRVGTAKLSKAEALDLDTEGKDTQRHVKAGSMVTAASSLSTPATRRNGRSGALAWKNPPRGPGKVKAREWVRKMSAR